MDFCKPDAKTIRKLAKEWNVDIGKGGIEKIKRLYKDRMKNYSKMHLIGAIRHYGVKNRHIG